MVVEVVRGVGVAGRGAFGVITGALFGRGALGEFGAILGALFGRLVGATLGALFALEVELYDGLRPLDMPPLLRPPPELA